MDELKVMRRLSDTIALLPPAVRRRVLAWLFDRFGAGKDDRPVPSAEELDRIAPDPNEVAG